MNSNLTNWLLGLAFAALSSALLCGSAAAQFPFEDFEEPDPFAAKPQAEPVDPFAGPRLNDSLSSSSDYAASKPTVAELRMARAQYRSQQRTERLERNLWAGYEPLRPNWNPIPMMSSRYPYRATRYVPVYVYPR
ncbi:hypothetical protein NHH03_00515 [Stieleria sp. TO1_6]|uniref:hypothetical protein n=1 Tax=Stieleria tagensis TaxID=2956795 RepID=UPI00209A747D|nr:hypothetical protein [Stieleria tagensis]MCO8120203.1 hypothetical protein [Stieleria tagensis]